ncbi:MAG: hypothetical protein IJP61_04020 [Treponema sp.]|nr:hypothetical protein [Treponema sp.]
MFSKFEKIKGFPVAPFLDEICGRLKSSPSRFLVLTAQTAAGKSTCVPLSVLEHFTGKVLMTEPRRLSVTAVSERMAFLLGEECGKTVGYTVHLESKRSSSTRLDVMTEAVLLRRIQGDPLLDGVNVLILDEFHERSIPLDLSLSLLKETMSLRDDLFVLVMSATIDEKSICSFLNSDFMEIPGRLFPVRIDYRPNISVVRAVRDCFYDLFSQEKIGGAGGGSVLVFLPGIREIEKTRTELLEYFSPDEAEILILHSSVSLSEQRKVLSPAQYGNLRRIILSSAIAETSVTVPDVLCVIDSGLCRMNEMDVSLGMERLVTVRESLFSAEQRSGRAGRVRQGLCVRLWDKNDVRPERSKPEILRADLTSLVLECALWGADSADKLSWLDSPSEASWNGAKSLLENLGCIKNGKITEKGRAVLSLPLHPRLACVALCGEKAFDTVLYFSEFGSADESIKKKFLSDLSRRVFAAGASFRKDGDEALFVLEGFPDRIAHLCEKNKDFCVFQFPSGRKAVLRESCATEWIVAVRVDAGAATGTIFSYKSLDESRALGWIDERCDEKNEISLSFGKTLRLDVFRVKAYGEIVLKKTKINATSEEFKSALCATLKKDGLSSIPFFSDDKIRAFFIRLEFFAQQKNDSSVLDKMQSLHLRAEEWLSPFISTATLDAETVFSALYWYFDGSTLDLEVPVSIVLDNGKKRKVSYEKQGDKVRPVMEIIIQQLFGCFKTPKIMGAPVLLRLLSPASRPLQVTDDLEHFWDGAWKEISKEMKSRYPKHNWDYRISE